MKKRELAVGAIVTLVAAFFLLFIDSFIERKTGSRAASTAFSSFLFPTGTLVVMLLCGLGLMAQAYLTLPAAPPEPMETRSKIAVVKIMAVSLVYALVMPVLGFLLATVPAMTYVFLVFGLPSRGKAFVYALATALLLYLVFAVFLRVPMPAGLLV